MVNGQRKDAIVLEGVSYENRTEEEIRHILFDGSSFNQCGLNQAQFSELGFNDSQFRYVGFDRANFEEVGMHGAQFAMVGITNAKFRWGTLEGASFEGTCFGCVRLEGVNLNNAVFSNCELDGLVINGVRIKELIESHPDYVKPADMAGDASAEDTVAAAAENTIPADQSGPVVEARKPQLGKAVQVRLVQDLEKAQAYYRDVLGCHVDGWGHAERDDMLFILQQAVSPDDVKPNAASAKRASYPTEWEGPEWGWDSFIYIGWEDLDAFVEEVRGKDGIIAIEPFTGAHGGWEFKNAYIQDIDGYNLVLGAMRKHEPQQADR